jgi:hypothetical protein
MKRRTRLRFFGCAAICGTFSFISGTGLVESVSKPVAPASGVPPRVHAPTGRVTVGTATLFQSAHRPLNLILTDQVLTIPPPPAATTPPPPPLPPAPTASDAGWQQVAVCEEGGSNDSTYGYFGIMPSSWAAAGGTAYSATAGGSSWDIQVMIGDRINGGPPWAPAGCAAAGYSGW